MSNEQLSLQDFYDQLKDSDRAYAQEQAEDIKAIANNATIQIGQKLIKVKERLGHGKFGEWIRLEFEWSHDQANRLMKISSEFLNYDDRRNFPQGTKSAYALASALAKEDEQGKEELLNGYQEKLEEKQQATPEGKTPSTSLTEKEIKELIKERNELKVSLESTADELENTKTELHQHQLDLTSLEKSFSEKIETAIAEKEDEIKTAMQKEKEKEIADRERQLQAQIKELDEQLEEKEDELTSKQLEFNKARKELEKNLEKFKANPDPETKKQIAEQQSRLGTIRSQLLEAEERLKEAQTKADERKAVMVTVTGFFNKLDEAFKKYPRIGEMIISPYLDEGYREQFTRIKKAFRYYADLIEDALRGDINSDFVDVSAVEDDSPTLMK